MLTLQAPSVVRTSLGGSNHPQPSSARSTWPYPMAVSDLIPLWYPVYMEVSTTLRSVRTRAGLSLRDLGLRAGTSHSAIAAYEQGRVDPSGETVARIVRAAGFAIDLDISPRCRGTSELPRGDELIAVLDLASEFPAKHSLRLNAPVFGR